jgi:hypothetical protein
VSDGLGVTDGHPQRAATAFLPMPLAPELHQDLPHRLRGDGKEMRAILPLDPVTSMSRR